jgi:hypothetical protein
VQCSGDSYPYFAEVNTLKVRDISMKIIAAFFMFFMFLSDARSAEQSLEMTKALQTLVASQNLEKNWPLIIQNSGKTGAAVIQRSALASLAGKPGFTDAQRRKAAGLIAEWSVPMAEEIDALNRAIDVKALLSDMAQTVYPKYFTSSEINDLAAFYSSKAFQKTVEIGLRVGEESARTGKSRESLWAKYDSMLTPDDKKSLAAFGNSAIGKKQQTVGPALGNDMRDFIQSRTDASVNEVADRYGKLLAAKLKDGASD